MTTESTQSAATLSPQTLTHARQFFIGGTWVEPATSATLDVINPATEQSFEIGRAHV